MLRCFGTVPSCHQNFRASPHDDIRMPSHYGTAVLQCRGFRSALVLRWGDPWIGDSQHCRKRPIFRGFRVLKAGPRRGRGGQGGKDGLAERTATEGGQRGVYSWELSSSRSNRLGPSRESVFPVLRVGPVDTASARGAQLDDGDRRAGTDPFEQFRLGWFECNEPAEHVKQVDQLRRVFREPVIGLDVSQLRGGRRSPMIGRSRFALR